MRIFKKAISSFLAFAILCISFPAIGVAKPETVNAKDTITENVPNIKTTTELDIPVEKIEGKKTSKWVWIGLGALAVGGLAAAGGGGGGGGDDTPASTDQSQAPAGDTGDVTVQW